MWPFKRDTWLHFCRNWKQIIYQDHSRFKSRNSNRNCACPLVQLVYGKKTSRRRKGLGEIYTTIYMMNMNNRQPHKANWARSNVRPTQKDKKSNVDRKMRQEHKLAWNKKWSHNERRGGATLSPLAAGPSSRRPHCQSWSWRSSTWPR